MSYPFDTGSGYSDDVLTHIFEDEYLHDVATVVGSLSGDLRQLEDASSESLIDVIDVASGLAQGGEMRQRHVDDLISELSDHVDWDDISNPSKVWEF